MTSPGTCWVMDRIAHADLLTWFTGVFCALALAGGPGVAMAAATDGGAPASAAPTTAPAPTSPADATVAAASQQAAAAVALAVQDHPVNVAIPVKILSPGDSAPITQVNVSSADAQAVNASQAQQSSPAAASPAPAAATPVTPPAASAQQAGSGQSATAVAQSTQIAPTNIYIPVSILSPGGHGPVTQINVSGAQATATNIAQTTGQGAGAGAAGQVAGAGAGASQQAPSNVSAPVTVGGVGVGDHSPSQPWVWSWSWELDCSAGAPPPIAQLAPIIAAVTNGAWQWDWTWTCAPQASGDRPAPAANGDQGPAQSIPMAAPAQEQRAARAEPAASRTGAAGSGRGPARAQGPKPAHRTTPVGGNGGVADGVAHAVAARFRLAAAGDITAFSVVSPAAATGDPRPRSGGGARAPRTPSRTPPDPPGPMTPTLFSAGVSGGSGPGPLSVGLAALIGAFALYVPGFGTRARARLVPRSAQTVPRRRHRPG